MVVFGNIGFSPAKSFFRARWLYLGKLVLIGKNRLYSGKSGLNRTKWLYSDKVVVFGQSSCIREKVIVFRQSGCI